MQNYCTTLCEYEKKHRTKVFKITITGLNTTFLRPNRLSGRNNVMLDKVNFRTDIRTSRV